MDFRIRGLDYQLFAPLFALSDDALRANGSARRITSSGSTSPCRVSLRYAAPGETVILTSFMHLSDPGSPYRSLGPIFVRQDAGPTFDCLNEIPSMLQTWPLSLRAYDRRNMIVAAEVTTGDALPDVIGRLFGRDDVAILHVHHAAYGCFQCRVERA